MSDVIPILDLGDFMARKPGALQASAHELQRACQEIGFFFIRGHGVSQGLVDACFAASQRFHAQPLADKRALQANEHNIGYMALGDSVSRASKVYEGERKTNLVAAYFLKRDLPLDHRRDDQHVELAFTLQ